MSKKYFSEIMLLTKSLYADELFCWLEWHLNIIHVDHIVLLDNESPIDIKSILSRFSKDKIEYHLIEGWSDQKELYTHYLRQSESQWVIPLDDDEYLYLGDKYNKDIKTFITTLMDTYHRNMYYILWTNLLSETKLQKHEDLYINTHIFYTFEGCRKMYGDWSRDNGWGKCLVNTDLEYTYGTGRESTCHIPLCINRYSPVVLVNGVRTNLVNPLSIQKEHLYYRKDEIDLNKDCFIAHYHYKTKEDWVIKCDRGSVLSKNIILKDKVRIYDKIFEYQKEFKPCTLLRDIWNNHIF